MNTHIYIFIYAYIYIYIYKYMCVYIYVCIYACAPWLSLSEIRHPPYAHHKGLGKSLL